jgi:hypothetical protein
LGIEAEGGATTTDVGKYVVVHETRSDGSTKILLDCFNSNAPPPHRHGRLGLGDGTDGHTGAAVQCGSEHRAVTTAACRRLSHNQSETGPSIGRGTTVVRSAVNG